MHNEVFFRVTLSSSFNFWRGVAPIYSNMPIFGHCISLTVKARENLKIDLESHHVSLYKLSIHCAFTRLSCIIRDIKDLRNLLNMVKNILMRYLDSFRQRRKKFGVDLIYIIFKGHAIQANSCS